MKRLREETSPAFSQLTQLVQSAEPHQARPFAKRYVQSRVARLLENGSGKRVVLQPLTAGAGALLVAATAAAAGYHWLAPLQSEPPQPKPQASAAVVPSSGAPRGAAPTSAASSVAPPEPAERPEPTSQRPQLKPRAGEDPSQVAEAVRALRKEGDAARAQALLDRYLKANPQGALSEDALALSIEAAAARKDPRAADYARRYLARYPSGRFKGLAERVLAH